MRPAHALTHSMSCTNLRSLVLASHTRTRLSSLRARNGHHATSARYDKIVVSRINLHLLTRLGVPYTHGHVSLAEARDGHHATSSRFDPMRMSCTNLHLLSSLASHTRTLLSHFRSEETVIMRPAHAIDKIVYPYKFVAAGPS